MACFSPCYMLRFYNSHGKKEYKYVGKADNITISNYFSEDTRLRLMSQNDYIIVPCGNCIGCRLDYSATWADRMLCESFDKESLFVTLTYNDDNIHLNRFGLGTISNEDITIFIRDLRNKFRDVQVRYCEATEYGDTDLRPHAHLILYNLDFDSLDCYFYKNNNLGEPMYNSNVLSDIWKDKGFVVVEKANFYNMAYTARYILKKQKGVMASEYEAFEITPPSFRTSRRPGIGYDWLLNHYEELYEQGYFNVSRAIKPSGRITPNRYFDKLVEVWNPSLLQHSKVNRRLSSLETFSQKKATSSMTDDNILSYYEFEKENFLKRKTLDRM